MRRMQAVYFRDRDGHEPVQEFLDGLPVRHQVALDNQIDRLNMLKPDDPPLPFPHSSQVRGELRELRCHFGDALYRILYRRSEGFFVLLHAFRKDTAKIQESDIRVAEERWLDFKARMDAPSRVPPRAMGHDAPLGG